MKRFAGLVVLMALTTPAYASSYSFVIGGHHIHVEASWHCRSLSCVSWSEINKKRDRDDAASAAAAPAPAPTPVATVAVPSKTGLGAAESAPVTPPAAPATGPAPAPVAAQPAPLAPQPQLAVAPMPTPAQIPPVQMPPAPAVPVQQPAAVTAPLALKPVETRTVVVTPPPPVAAPPAAAPAPVAVEPAPKADSKTDPNADPKAEPKPSVGFDLRPDAKLEPKVESKVETKPEVKPETTATVTKTPTEKPQADKPPVATKPAPSKTTLQSEGDGIEAPLGDWQTEGRKGLVRIEPCGTALCGYMINTATNTKGETVLINMKPKANSEWSGSIYSRSSGNTYYATMSMKRPNTLRVEACVVGHYFCSGNNWARLATKSDDITTREASAETR